MPLRYIIINVMHKDKMKMVLAITRASMLSSDCDAVYYLLAEITLHWIGLGFQFGRKFD